MNYDYFTWTALTIAEINQENKLFWSEQMALTEQLLSNPSLVQAAWEELDFEVARGIPLKQRKTLEKALVDVARIQSVFQTDLSRKGGKAAKRDRLQVLIEAIVAKEPGITERQLWHRLRAEIGNGVIVSIDLDAPASEGHTRRIHFLASDGKVKTAPVSGLKDRLSRAKAKIASH